MVSAVAVRFRALKSVTECKRKSSAPYNFWIKVWIWTWEILTTIANAHRPTTAHLKGHQAALYPIRCLGQAAIQVQPRYIAPSTLVVHQYKSSRLEKKKKAQRHFILFLPNKFFRPPLIIIFMVWFILLN